MTSEVRDVCPITTKFRRRMQHDTRIITHTLKVKMVMVMVMVSCPVLSCPALPALPFPVLPCPALPYPTLPYHILSVRPSVCLSNAVLLLK